MTFQSPLIEINCMPNLLGYYIIQFCACAPFSGATGASSTAETKAEMSVSFWRWIWRKLCSRSCGYVARSFTFLWSLEKRVLLEYGLAEEE